MYITPTNIPIEVKKEDVFNVLWKLKNYNLKVKAYYLWLKAKEKINMQEIEKAYEIIVWSINEVKKEELERKFWIFKKNQENSNNIKKTEQEEKENENIEINL